MFSFIGRLFGKAKKKELTDVEKQAEIRRAEAAPPVYTLDFEGADEIVVSAKNCDRDNFDAQMHHIGRTAEIAEIVRLLKKLPKAGEVQKDCDPCSEHTLTAHKGKLAFATVTFYEDFLKLENDAFIANNAKALKTQAELFNLIKIKLK